MQRAAITAFATTADMTKNLLSTRGSSARTDISDASKLTVESKYQADRLA